MVLVLLVFLVFFLLLVALGFALVATAVPIPVLARMACALLARLVTAIAVPWACGDEASGKRDADGQNEYCGDCLTHCDANPNSNRRGHAVIRVAVSHLTDLVAARKVLASQKKAPLAP